MTIMQPADDGVLAGEAALRIGVLLVDPCEITREALSALLGSESDIRIVGQADDLASAILAMSRLRPDVVVLDPNAVRSGLDAVASIIRTSPTSRVVVFSDHDNPMYVRAAIGAGASAYVLRNAERSDLLQAVREVYRGNHFLQPEVTGPLLRRLAERSPAREGAPLTRRELEILQHLANGESNKEIAASLGISPQTVKTHLKQLFKKLQVADRTGAVSLALRCRLVG